MGFLIGYTPWNKGKTIKDDVRIAKLATSDGSRLSNFWFKKGEDTWNKGNSGYHTTWKGQTHTEETKKKISEHRKGKAMGKDNGWWNGGGCQTERHSEMGRWQYKEWRTAVFTRDNFTCQLCGQVGGKLQADHIVPWSIDTSSRYKISNGRTLCISCHRSLSTWGARVISNKRSKLFLSEGGGKDCMALA